jgi:hypothetical protein
MGQQNGYKHSLNESTKTQIHVVPSLSCSLVAVSTKRKWQLFIFLVSHAFVYYQPSTQKVHNHNSQAFTSNSDHFTNLADSFL